MDLWLPGHSNRPQLVRNAHGQPLPCCWHECDRPGDNRVQIQLPHEEPRYRGEKLIYIFCSEAHKLIFVMHANRRHPLAIPKMPKIIT